MSQFSVYNSLLPPLLLGINSNRTNVNEINTIYADIASHEGKRVNGNMTTKGIIYPRHYFE